MGFFESYFLREAVPDSLELPPACVFTQHMSTLLSPRVWNPVLATLWPSLWVPVGQSPVF